MLRKLRLIGSSRPTFVLVGFCARMKSTSSSLPAHLPFCESRFQLMISSGNLNGCSRRNFFNLRSRSTFSKLNFVDPVDRIELYRCRHEFFRRPRVVRHSFHFAVVATFTQAAFEPSDLIR